MPVKKEIPSYWKDKPEWFRSNEWLIENQEHVFVKRLGNVIHGIQMDMNIKKKDDTPMKATADCLMGDIAVNAQKFQFKEALKEMKTLTGDDFKQAEMVLEKFNKEFVEYLPSLV